MLRQPVRQSGDRDFVHLLNEVRLGGSGNNIAELCSQCNGSRKPAPADAVARARLCCTIREDQPGTLSVP